MVGRPPGAGGEAPRLSRALLKDRYFPNLSLAYHVHALPEYDVVYVKNPKAACSTLLLWLHRIHTGDLSFSPENVHRENAIPRPDEIGWARVISMLDGAAYRFSFVRDPVRRFESAYRDKVVHSRRWREQVQRTLGQPADPDAEVTFEAFLDAVERQDPITEMDPHWRPQHVNLMHPLVAYDRIGHLETFAADLARIREEAGLPDVPVETRNVAKGAGSSPDLPTRSPAQLDRVRRLYATDFELYGY